MTVTFVTPKCSMFFCSRLQRFGVFFNGDHLSLRAEQRRLDGEAAGAGTDIKYAHVVPQARLGHGDRAHLGLGHRHIAADELFVAESAGGSDVHRLLLSNPHHRKGIKLAIGDIGRRPAVKRSSA